MRRGTLQQLTHEADLSMSTTDQKAHTILVVDDDVPIVQVLKALLSRQGFEVNTATSGRMAADLLNREKYDLLLTDIRMSNMDGIELLQVAQRLAPNMPVIMMTACATVDTASASMRLGAFDYVRKPFKIEDLTKILSRALRARARRDNYEGAPGALRAVPHFQYLFGESEPMRGLYAEMEKLALTDNPLLISGPLGVGKTLVARATHEASRRGGKAFEICDFMQSSDPDECRVLLYGAANIAGDVVPGLFERTHGGTLLLKNIGYMPPELQEDFLKIIVTKEFSPVGSPETRSLDARLMATDCQVLHSRVREGMFSEALLYRIGVFSLHVPPLRSRSEDIPILAMHFLAQWNESHNASLHWDGDALAALQMHTWPENVNELRSVVQHGAAQKGEGAVEVEDLPEYIQSKATSAQLLTAAQGKGGPQAINSFLQERELRAIRLVFQKCNGNAEKAAAVLGISINALKRKCPDLFD